MPLQKRLSPLIQLWTRLTEPDASVRDAEARQNCRVLAGLLLALAVMIATLLPARYLANAGSPYMLSRLASAFFGFLVVFYAYQLTRRGHYHTAGQLAAIAGSLVIFISAAMVDESVGLGMLYYIVINTLFASLFLSFRFALLLSASHIIGMLLFPVLIPGYRFNRMLEGPASFTLMMSLVALVFASYRVYLERQRRLRLAESEARYRIISESISDYAFSFRVDPDGDFHREWITESFTRVTGFRPQELDERGKFALFHPDDVQMVMDDLAALLRGESRVGEYRIVTKSGETRWIALYRNAVWDATHKRVVRYYGVAQDITDRKRAEIERLKTAVQQERLRLLGGFVEAVSHDFRTSLATIETNRYLLSATIGKVEVSKTDERLNTIHGSVQHMAEQLENLHTLSSLIAPNMSPYSINTLTQTLVENCKAAAARKGVKLCFAPGDSLPLVDMDVDEIKRALKQLLVNAINYTPEGGSVMVRTYEKGGMVSVEVKDTGMGIAARDLPHIFEFFYRADSSRPIEQGGVGLGLSLVRMIAEAHRGKVTVSSEPGQGSTFTLSLPVEAE